jgi:leucyl aminopeptidase (aminopeptidase T)
MINDNLEKLAKVVVDYSLKVEKGHLVGIEGPSFAVDMFQALTAEITKKGAHVMVMPAWKASGSLSLNTVLMNS